MEELKKEEIQLKIQKINKEINCLDMIIFLICILIGIGPLLFLYKETKADNIDIKFVSIVSLCTGILTIIEFILFGIKKLLENINYFMNSSNLSRFWVMLVKENYSIMQMWLRQTKEIYIKDIDYEMDQKKHDGIFLSIHALKRNEAQMEIEFLKFKELYNRIIKDAYINLGINENKSIKENKMYKKIRKRYMSEDEYNKIKVINNESKAKALEEIVKINKNIEDMNIIE